MENKVKVAIIDDGVDANKYLLSGNWIANKNSIISNTKKIKFLADNHATTCCNIIYKYLKKTEIELYSIKIFDSIKKNGNIINFIKALEFCVKLNIKLIHLSIGSSEFEDFEIIKLCVEHLTKNNIIIVAACNNQGKVTYPACLPNVIGVKCDTNLKDDQYYYYNCPSDGINIHASSLHIYRNENKIVFSPISNSYAAPMITSKVILYLYDNPNGTIKDIQNYLFDHAINKVLI